MKKEIEKLDIELKYGYHCFKGEYYEIDSRDGKPFFKKVDIKKIKEQEELAKKIAEKLKDNLDPVAVIKESLMKIQLKDIKKLYKNLFESKRKYKPKTREHHCVDMKIGNFILPIAD